MSVSDDRARQVGTVTLVVFLTGPALILLALLFSAEIPHLLDRAWFVGGSAGLSVLAYGSAALTARAHMMEARYLDTGDREGWDWRMSTKVAFLVPFIYLLSTPAERQVGRPRPQKGV